ncbi:MAG TPA: ATP-binding protein [Kofleriaceae bacterium]|nr:ATP-binding protein [Kofleriaceae bacterium]
MLEFVIEAMVDAVMVIDAEGRITLANSGATQLTNYSREELRGMSVSTLLVDDSSGLRTVTRRRIEDGDVLRREESWLVTKESERIPVSITGSPVVNDQGTLQGIVLVARDVREMRGLLADKEAEISRRRKAEDELRAAKASIEDKLDQMRTQLLLAERRATLGTLAGGVGHELRNIAQIQIAALDELASTLRADDKLRTILAELERVGEHITAHGNRLMQLARPGPQHVSPIDLNNVVRDVAAMLKLAGKLGRVELVLSLPAAPVIVTVNRTSIEQIFVNLIINAVDATSESGTITVEVRPTGDRVTCGVSDTGVGIAGDQFEKIFEPFYTTKGDLGTGLGLPVVREIVTSYGGDIKIDSTVGAGTTFTFDLPV